MRRMLRPKVTGMIVLDELAVSTGAPLDFFVLFSSTAALLGSNLLGHYAAANTCLDAYAQARRVEGCPITSVAWGRWAELRIASEEFNRSMDAAGLKMMPVAQALDAFGQLRLPAPANVIVVEADWAQLKAVYESRRQRPMLREIGQASAVDRRTRGTEHRR